MRILLICLGLLASLPVSLAAADEKEVEYYAVLVDGKKIGHMVHTRSVEGRTVTTLEETNMTIARAGMLLAIGTVDKTIETIEGKPLAFEFVQNMSGISQKIAGKVTDGKVEVALEMMGTTQQQVLDWPDGAVMYEGMRLFEVEKGLTKGTAYEVKVFVPMLVTMAQTGEQAAVTAKVNVGETTNIDLFGRVVNLTQVEVLMQMPTGQINSISYVDKDFRALKTVVPTMGMNLEIIACDREFALSDNDIVDFLDKLIVQCPVALEDIGSKKSITYELVPTEGARLEIPSGDNQKVTKGKNGKLTVTVEPVKGEKGTEFPYKGQDPLALEALKATTYLQSNNKQVQDLARHAVGGTKDVAEAVRQIESFVAGFITAKDLSVGYASAAEVAQSRQGDCTEHAVLTAAMCRALGIPARVVFGIVYVQDLIGHENVFGGHAWTQAFVGGKWVGLDATRAPDGFGPGHIALAVGSGEPADFFGMINTLGYFKIDKVSFSDARE
jgi:hypothetical protein